jgi:hypothetical protein
MKPHQPRNLFKPDSPVSGLAPAVQAFAAANLLSSHLGDARKITLNLDLTATIDELRSQLLALDDVEFMRDLGAPVAGFNIELARTRMQNCLKIAQGIQQLLELTAGIELATVQAGPPPPDQEASL